MRTSHQYSEHLRRRGLRVTAQRLTVQRIMHERGEHLTAEAVYDLARDSLPSLSLTTVYKILGELVNVGEIQRVDLGDGSARFDRNAAEHAHLVCRVCGRLEDLPASDYHVGLPVVAAHGYQIDGHAVLFHGRCPACLGMTLAG